MARKLNNTYIILFFISLFLFILKFKKIYKYKGWFYKTIFLILSGLFTTISLVYENRFIDELILPLLLFFNILILIFITIRNKQTQLDYIPIILISYLLFTFNVKDFKINNGKLVKVNKKWLYIYIITLILYFLISNNKTITFYSKIGLILLVLYPLLFPLNEYFIHRIYSLCITISINYHLILK
tara:strand:+ start:333 stop:887 length:555 start_codon:yes stop_codon:yes gene_type:complete